MTERVIPYHFDVAPFDLIKQSSLREHIQRVGVNLTPLP